MKTYWVPLVIAFSISITAGAAAEMPPMPPMPGPGAMPAPRTITTWSNRLQTAPPMTSQILAKPTPIPMPMPSAPVRAVAVATNSAGPRIRFGSLTHDFGKIAGGEITKCEFVFTNTGESVLEITDVRPGCGCTGAGQWTRQVEPGKTGTIPLQFNSANFIGTVMKNATVTCNDPTQQNVVLYLKATIWRPIDVSPQFAILNLTTEIPSNSTVVRIVNNLDQPIELSPPESKNPAFAAELKTIKPGKEFQMIVTTVSPIPNSMQGQITVKTSSTNMPVISVTAWANVQQTVLAMPAQLALPAGPLANNLTQTVWVRNNSVNPIALSEPTVSVKGATVTAKDFQPGKYFSLTITFPAGLQLSPNEKAELTVKTTHPQYPLLKVPIIQPQPPFGPAMPNQAMRGPLTPRPNMRPMPFSNSLFQPALLPDPNPKPGSENRPNTSQ